MINKKEIEREIDNFGREIIKKVAVTTHTDWSYYYEPVLKKYRDIIIKKIGELIK